MLNERASSTHDPLVGRIIEDRYRVLYLIGKGGMGSVYLAEHVLIGRKVAIKTLHPELMARPETVTRFHREALAASAIGQEHIVDVTDMGQLEDGSYYMVLEYLEGSDLAFRMASEGPFTIARSLRVLLQLCEALEAVHEAGIIHRDLKPENLFLVDGARHPDYLKVLDFGICKIRDAHLGAERRVTGTGVVLGTPHFMAPEQIEGQAGIDGRVDVYAAGTLLHFLLAGSPPFDAPTLPKLFMRICHEPPPRLKTIRPEISRQLDDVVARALAKNPAQRWPSAAALRAALTPLSIAADKIEARSERRAPSSLRACSAIRDVRPSDPTPERTPTLPSAPSPPPRPSQGGEPSQRIPRLRPWPWIVTAVGVLLAGAQLAFGSGAAPHAPRQSAAATTITMHAPHEGTQPAEISPVLPADPLPAPKLPPARRSQRRAQQPQPRASGKSAPTPIPEVRPESLTSDAIAQPAPKPPTIAPLVPGLSQRELLPIFVKPKDETP